MINQIIPHKNIIVGATPRRPEIRGGGQRVKKAMPFLHASIRNPEIRLNLSPGLPIKTFGSDSLGRFGHPYIGSL